MSTWVLQRGSGKVPHMASVYLIPLLLGLTAHGIHTLDPVAAVVFVFGVFETILQWRSAMYLLPLLLHLMVRPRRPSMGNWALSLTMLATLLLLYYRLDAWPYESPPLLAACVGLAALLACLADGSSAR